MTKITTVKQVLQGKGNAIWSITPESTVLEALQLMADKDVGALLVMKEGKLAGIFSERDYARKAILKEKPSKDMLVKDFMTRELFYISPDTTIEECMALITQKRIRHLPVMEEGQVVGVLSIGDVVKKLISDQDFTIQQLENYVLGEYGM
ncbi:putative signal transduction protein with CBS domains [Candidatus Vecturithrix granuli]|uniref:Putative signal transduction protein with CBS domains n=1 Tax=Vecturithrix granuli TaxID=1499967 RepID=A0A081CAS0_VECG1|nr:putative signal transduction protein with CBS domains [Candidatus Vecturithrix granuli]